MSDASDAYKKVCREAVLVQDACNLSGVLGAWQRAQRVLMDKHGGNGKLEYFHDPVNILFLSKVASLLELNSDCIGGVKNGNNDVFTDAYKAACKEMNDES